MPFFESHPHFFLEKSRVYQKILDICTMPTRFTNMKKWTLIILILGWINQTLVQAQSDTSTVIILSINDLHAKINRFPQLKHVVDSIRSKHQTVWLFSAGDLFSGNPFVDKYEKPGQPMILLMNDIPFDLSAFGNHEFDYGIKTLNERVSEASFPFVCANIQTQNSGLKQPEPFKIFTSPDGTTFSVFSVLQIGQNKLPDSHPKNFEGVCFVEPNNAVAQHRKALKKTDIQIFVTHLGYRSDLEIAKQNQWVDVIIGGHTHKTIDPAEKVGQVWITQAGSDVQLLGVNTLKIHKHRLVSFQNQLIPLKMQARDSVMQDQVKSYSKRPEFQVEIAQITYPIDSQDEIGLMMAESYKEGLNADFAFQNLGGVRVDKIDEGLLKLFDIMFLDPFNNEILLFDLTENEILGLLNYAYGLKHKEKQLMAGLKAEYILNNDQSLKDIRLSLPDGTALDPNKKYKVALNSYMTSSYQFDGKETAQYTSQFSNDLLVKYFKAHFPLKP